MNCPNCKTQLPEGTKFCYACGCAQPQPQQEATLREDRIAPEKCVRCGTVLQQGTRFCAACGCPVDDHQNVRWMTPVNSGGLQPRRDQKRSKKGWLIGGACTAALALTLSILIPALVRNAKQKRYDEAISMLGYGQYAQAMTEFTELGDFSDAATRAAECRMNIAYQDAAALFDKGEYLSAATAFDRLGAFGDAADRAVECRAENQYQIAGAYMEENQLEKALEALTALTPSGYKDTEELIAYCNNELTYTAAWEAYCAGKYYTAYTGFSMLTDYRDAADLALACIQTRPKTEQLYRNPDYAKKAVSLKIISPSQEDRPTYMKVFSAETDALVCTLFFNAQSKLTIRLPQGSYYFNYAYGTTWFGEQEMFGEIGSYKEMVFDDGTRTIELTSRYNYTITMVERYYEDLSSDPDMDPQEF